MPSRSAYPLTILCVTILTTTLGCESLRYYTQAISGQFTILKRRKPIDTLISDPNTSPDLKKQLRTVLALREFARDVLYLPVNDSYLSFADLHRPYAVWNVYAAPEFSLTPKTWCYPLVGCLAYRGFFAQQNALDYAEKLRMQEYDTFVSGIAAYSTLGWFADPVLNTFVYRREARLAALLFHELAHRLLYVADDTTYSESFATALEQEGLRRWLGTKADTGALNAHMSDYRRHQEFVRLVITYREQLESVYRGDSSPEGKRREKSALLERLRDDYRALKAGWNGYSGYDAWFRHPLNNAQIITVSTYHDLVPAFTNLLRASDNNLRSFYRKCRDLSKRPRQERLKELGKYAMGSGRSR